MDLDRNRRECILKRLRVCMKFASKGGAGDLRKDSDPECPAPSVFIEFCV
jgi:hypothetical protein